MTAEHTMTESPNNGEHRGSERILSAMIEHPWRLLMGIFLLSVVIVFAGIQATPDRDVSFNPSGEIFDTEALVDKTFRPSTNELTYLVTDDNGDALDADTLKEWFHNVEAVRSSSDLSDELTTFVDGSLRVTVNGIYTIADAVDAELRASRVPSGLDQATNDQVKVALSSVLSVDRATVALRDRLSIHAVQSPATVNGQEITLWTSPGFLETVTVDRAAFPVDLENDTDPATRTASEQEEIDGARGFEIEKWARDAQDLLRGDEANMQVWGIGIDQSLTEDEAFEATIPFLVGAFLIIVLLVGVLLRSYWAAAIAGTGLTLTLLLARMVSNIVGFEESLILDIIVPIATISFGVDFMIHAIGRVREQQTAGDRHRSAYVVGIAAVGGALVLALSTSSIAFGSNATSGIPGIIEFGYGAAISLGSAFLVLGILSPLYLLKIEERLHGVVSGPRTRVSRILSAVKLIVAALFAALAILMVIGFPQFAIAGVVLYAGLFVALPVWWQSRKRPANDALHGEASDTPSISWAFAGKAVVTVVRWRYALVAVVAAVTAVAAFGAANVETKTEFTDFLPSDSDLIKGFDKVFEHSESLGGGEFLIYVSGDLDNPATLTSMAASVDEVSANGGDNFARTPDGSIAVPDSAVEVARQALHSEFARAAITVATGVSISDENNDGFPDTSSQVGAVFEYASANGIPVTEDTFVYTPDDVAQLLARNADGTWATVLHFPVQGELEAAQVTSSKEVVDSASDKLQNEVTGQGLALTTSVSGSVITLQTRVDAITDAMVISVPLAALLCMIAAAFVMRSPLLAAVSIVPIGLVIVWLLGFMKLFDYNLNVVTATITAISVGVGIDFSIHYTLRFREELRKASSRMAAVELAAEETGTALVLSGLTSVFGFAFLALAPLPVFAAFGLLTAVMIAFSLFASLTVLPTLLYFVSSEPVAKAVAETQRGLDPETEVEPVKESAT